MIVWPILATILLVAYNVCTARAANSLEEGHLIGAAAWALAGGVVIAIFVRIMRAF